MCRKGEMRTHANQLKGKAADGEIPNVMAICTETNDYSNFSIWKVKMDRLSWDCTCHCQTDICTPGDLEVRSVSLPKILLEQS